MSGERVKRLLERKQDLYFVRTYLRVTSTFISQLRFVANRGQEDRSVRF